MIWAWKRQREIGRSSPGLRRTSRDARGQRGAWRRAPAAEGWRARRAVLALPPRPRRAPLRRHRYHPFPPPPRPRHRGSSRMRRQLVPRCRAGRSQRRCAWCPTWLRLFLPTQLRSRGPGRGGDLTTESVIYIFDSKYSDSYKFPFPLDERLEVGHLTNGLLHRSDD